jgi:hypothetical protein
MTPSANRRTALLGLKKSLRLERFFVLELFVAGGVTAGCAMLRTTVPSRGMKCNTG